MPGFDAAARTRLTRALKQEARRLGFDGCGVSKAEPLDEEAVRLEQWLLEGRYGTMDWMAEHFDERIDPTTLVEGAQSVISVLQHYDTPPRHDDDPETANISRYAWGDDYHTVMKDALHRLYRWLEAEVDAEIYGRAFVDSAPVMDKAWAARSGLGWQGKHTNLLNREAGSFFFLGELIVDVPLAADGPVPDSCGTCTRCLDACPTDALYQPYAIDASRCISYLTIEHATDDVPGDLVADVGSWIFGCDICQDVCPWNKFRQTTREARYRPRDGVVSTDLRDWAEINLDEFERRFADSPVERATFQGFQRNVRNAIQSINGTAG